MRFLFYAGLAIVGGLLLFFTHRYLWQRLVRDTEMSGWAKRIATALIVGGGLTVPLVMAIAKFVSREYVELIVVAAFAWLGSALYLVLLLAPFEVARKVMPGRRRFLARAAAGTAFIGTAGLVTIGTKNALGEFEVNEIEVPLERLPKALDGFRIAQLSDLHIGPILDGRFLEAVVEKTNALKPDLVVITGDLVDGTPSIIGRDVARLAQLESRFGTLFVTGNHEYYSGARLWIDFLDRHGIRSLTNERTVIGDAAASFDLAGIPDRQGGIFDAQHSPDLPRALEGRDPDRELVLLAHRPNPIDEAADHGVGLQLSGHTHGGQLWPITAATRLVHPYVSGLHHHRDNTWIHVSRGTGFWGPPMRILAPAEITAVVLTSKA